MGYYDDWRVMATARTVKIYLSTCVCIQLLKIIKFTNVLIPKMSLMTSVLSKGKADLAFFGIVFGISMLAFSNMFYVQLGSVMEDYNDQARFLYSLHSLYSLYSLDSTYLLYSLDSTYLLTICSYRSPLCCRSPVRSSATLTSTTS